MSKLNIIQYPCKNNRCYQQAVKRKPIGIQLHSIGCGQGTAKSVADYWNSPNVSALVQYIVDSDVEGKVLATLPEDIYAWADAGYGNRNLIAIEMCESDFMTYTGGANFKITNKQQFMADIERSYVTAVLLCADICMRYDWDPWKKLPSGLYLISSHNEGRLAGLSSAHVDPDHVWSHIDKSMDIFRGDVVKALAGATYVPITNEIHWYRVRRSWTDVQSQLGAYEVKQNAIDNCPYGYAVYDISGNEVHRNNNKPAGGTQASEFVTLTESVAAEKILKMVHENDKSGVLYSVSAAQCILESGYVKTTLAEVANNCFGMKTTLSGNTWDTCWDGVSKVTLPTWEHYNGRDVTVNADFRKYPCIEDSIKDHSEYLLGAMNGDKLRYKGLLVAKDYREAITIIKNGGYATDPNYISKICNIIQRFGLDRYDHEVTGEKKEQPVVPEKKVVYRVQVGRYASLALAKGWAATVTDITKLQCSIEVYQGDYQVICGSFDSQAGANIRAALLRKEYLVPCEVKEVTI